MKLKIVSNLYPSLYKPFKGTFVRNVLEGLKDKGCHVSLICLKEPTPNIFGKVFAYIKFFICSFISGMTATEGDIHYVHYTSHSSLGLILASFFKSKKKLIIVSNVHGSDVLPNEEHALSKYKIRISKKILDMSTLIVSPSEYFKCFLLDNYGVSEDKVIISPSGGVDSSIFHVLPSIRQDYTFGYVGRLEKDKGVFDLIEAFRLFQSSHQTSRLLIVGSGSCEMKLKEVIKSMTGVTLMQGMGQTQLVEVYNSINYLVFPSRAPESLGLIPIEAMMCGTPVLSTPVGATKEYIISDMRKFCFEPGNVEGLLAVLNKTSEVSDEEYLKLSRLALDVASNYSSNKVIDDLYQAFESRFDHREYR